VTKLRKIADLHHELIEPVEWKAPESGPRPYPVPPEFERDLSWNPPAVGRVEVSKRLVLDSEWMRRHQSTLARLYREERIVLVEDAT